MNLLVMVYLDFNLGDDLFIKVLKDRYKDSNIDIITRKPELLRAFKNDSKINAINYSEIIKNIKKYDAFIIIGGSIFQDYGNKKAYLTYMLRNLIVKLFKFNNKPTFIMGCNIGPINTNIGKKIFKYTFENSEFISVRDNESLRLLESINKVKNYNVYPDIVFNLQSNHNEEQEKIKRKLGISVINYSRKIEYKNDYIDKIVEISNKYLQLNPESTVNLFGFDSGNENDGIVIDEIINRIDCKFKSKINKNMYNGDIDLFLKAFQSCDFIIGTRFHSIILALKYNIDFFPIIYSEKTSNLLKDIKFNLDSKKYEDISSLDVDNLIKNMNEYKFSISKEYIKRSQGHFRKLDQIEKNRQL